MATQRYEGHDAARCVCDNTHKPKAERGGAEGITNQSQRNVLYHSRRLALTKGVGVVSGHKPKAERGRAEGIAIVTKVKGMWHLGQ